jgi:hypothetical protein
MATRQPDAQKDDAKPATTTQAPAKAPQRDELTNDDLKKVDGGMTWTKGGKAFD